MSKPRTPRLFRLRSSIAGSALLALTAASARAEMCAVGPTLDAARNAASLQSLPAAPFRRPEIGWAIYEAWIKADIGTSCSAGTPGFAGALARFRARHALGSGGVMDARTLAAFSRLWANRRPFVRISKIACLAPPAEAALATALPSESYGGKTIQLRPGALTAYRRLYAAARAAGVTAGDRDLLTIFSGFRDPVADAARCATEGNCQGVSRASCSAHLTGLAMDLTLGAAPGRRVDSADDVNRLYISKTPAYRWLVVNAGRFGFVNYVFEPWHWEWTGEAP
jgi:D-alanyl-D-alanine carboxypeptidase